MLIRASGIYKAYGNKTVLEPLSFELGKGQKLALLGTSGSGKTTCLKIINGLVTASGGTVEILGQQVSKANLVELRRKMGYVIQNIGLFPHYTIAQNIALIPKLKDWEKTQINASIRTWCERLKLDPDQTLHKYPNELSGGQQQRVGIARALAADPPIVLMDEPFGALDPITRNEIRSDFINLEELRDKTIIMVTHDIEEAFEMADEIILLDEGKVMQKGSPMDLLLNPANDFVREFIGNAKLQLGMNLITIGDLGKGIAYDPDLSVAQALEKARHHNGDAADIHHRYFEFIHAHG